MEPWLYNIILLSFRKILHWTNKFLEEKSITWLGDEWENCEHVDLRCYRSESAIIVQWAWGRKLLTIKIHKVHENSSPLKVISLIWEAFIMVKWSIIMICVPVKYWWGLFHRGAKCSQVHLEIMWPTSTAEPLKMTRSGWSPSINLYIGETSRYSSQ